MRMQAVLTQALGETGTATGRHLPRLFAVQAFNAGRRRHGHAKAQDRVVPMRPSSARQRARPISLRPQRFWHGQPELTGRAQPRLSGPWAAAPRPVLSS